MGSIVVKKVTNYISEIDQLLAELRATVPESEAQRKEREKYQRIAQKRDNATDSETIEIWEEF
jgi:hypothetical protein